jgi:hypothetical protein
MDMKWFNLPGSKEAFIQDVKLRWVDDADLDIPWIHFYRKSTNYWELFTLAFPDQAWTLQQMFLIDKSIDETLAGLERLVPSSYKLKSWTDTSNSADNFFDYFKNTASMHRQRELILHYTKVLSFGCYDASETDRVRLGTFRLTCIELAETACLSDRRKLVADLFSQDNTAALLAGKLTDAHIWSVRQECLRRGLMIQKAMDKLRGALGLEEEEEDEEEEEEEGEEGNDKNNAEETSLGSHNCSDCKNNNNTVNGVFDFKSCKDNGCCAPGDVAPDRDAAGLQYDLPVRGCSTCGTIVERNVTVMEGDWTSVVDENE